MKRSKENNRYALKWIFARIKRYFPLVIVISLIAALTALASVGIALVTKRVFDVATGDRTGRLITEGALLFGVVAAQILLNALHSFLAAFTRGKMTMSIRAYLFSSVCRKKYADISVYHSGDLLNRFTSDTDVIINASVSIIPSVVSMVTKIIAGIGTMLIMNPRLALLILLFGIAVPGIGRIINKRYKYLHKQCQKTEGKTRSFLQECFENTVVIKTFVSEIPFINKLNRYMEENFKIKLKQTNISIIAQICLYSFFTLGYYAVLVWGAGGIALGTLTYGTLMAFLQLVSQLRAPLQNISGIMPQYYSAIASAERLMELESLPNDKQALAADKLSRLKDDFQTLEVKELCFGYDNDEILENCSFTAERGHITAITGESGSGKSTLFKLILGLYEPQSGTITVNGELTLNSSMRGLFAYVPQGNMVLSGTVRENITLGNTEIDDAQIEKAAKAAEIYDFIVSTPNGFDTVLSERGAGLSEGQVQRISIARALLVDAPVLLLDEATSALDEETETRVLANIKRMTDKTVLFITHRNTSLKICDRIIHVKDKIFTEIK